jgi:hypothetical protein
MPALLFNHFMLISSLADYKKIIRKGTTSTQVRLDYGLDPENLPALSSGLPW